MSRPRRTAALVFLSFAYRLLPEQRVAHRTSPTNIGLALLANLAARDFGYLTEHQLVERTAATFDTMDRLQRFQGHFLNWYDTQSGATLLPQYVSTVDSGNLCGHLLAVAQACRELAPHPLDLHAARQGAEHGALGEGVGGLVHRLDRLGSDALGVGEAVARDEHAGEGGAGLALVDVALAHAVADGGLEPGLGGDKRTHAVEDAGQDRAADKLQRHQQHDRCSGPSDLPESERPFVPDHDIPSKTAALRGKPPGIVVACPPGRPNSASQAATAPRLINPVRLP